MELKIKNSLVSTRESIALEFKATFHKTNYEYIRTIAAFANSRGGEIVFGIKDKPREPLGLDIKKYQLFLDYDTKDLTTQIQNALSGRVDFIFDDFEQKISGVKKKFGVLKIEESNKKPIVCKIANGNNNLREGAIYYRYHGKSEEIKAQDLIDLIQSEKEKEKRLFLSHIEKIAKIGVADAGIFSYNGEMFAGDKKIIIDKEVIDKIKFIKDGEFVEKSGAPAIILKGEIKNVESVEFISKTSDPNVTHPYEGLRSVVKEILENEEMTFVERDSQQGKIKDAIHIISLDKNYSLTYVLQNVHSHLNIVDDIKFCWHNEKNTVRKYTESFVEKCIEILKSEKELRKIFN